MASLSFVVGVHIRFFGNGGLWFRPYGGSLLANAPKGTKRSRPLRTAPRQGSGFLRSGIHPGALLYGLLRCTSLQCVRLRRTALRAYPRMNTSAQPAEGAGGSKAAGELTLGLLSGEEQSRCSPICFCSALLWEQARSRKGRRAGRFALALAFDLLAPSRGFVPVLHSGQPGMDAGLAAYGHGWPIAVGPRSRTGARECRALARHRTKGARALGYLGPGGAPLFQVTRHKGGTVSGRYRSNGYVHLKGLPGHLRGLTESAGQPEIFSRFHHPDSHYQPGFSRLETDNEPLSTLMSLCPCKPPTRY